MDFSRRLEFSLKRDRSSSRLPRLFIPLACLCLVFITASCKRSETPVGGAPAPAAKAEPAVLRPSEVAPIVGRVTRKVGTSSRLKGPRGVAIDRNGNLYVADTGNGRVVKFDASGREVTTFGKQGSGPGEFSLVSRVAVSGQGNLLALDSETGWVHVFAPDGKVIRRLGGSDARLYHPSGMAVMADGTVVIADTGGDRIVFLNADGLQQSEPIKAPDGHKLSQPTDVSADPAGQLHIYQPATGPDSPPLLFHLTADRKLKNIWHGPPAPSTSDSPRFAFGPNSSLYATSPQSNRVIAYAEDGRTYHPIRLEGSDSAPFQHLGGIAVDSAGRLYVTDMEANVVYVIEVAAPAAAR
jgi:tripartite motif-containing protein 71